MEPDIGGRCVLLIIDVKPLSKVMPCITMVGIWMCLLFKVPSAYTIFFGDYESVLNVLSSYEEKTPTDGSTCLGRKVSLLDTIFQHFTMSHLGCGIKWQQLRLNI